MVMMGRLPLLVLVLAVMAACGSSSNGPTPTVSAIPDCGTGFPGLPPTPSRQVDVADGTEFAFDAELICNGKVEAADDLPHGAWALVRVLRVTSGPKIAVGDEIVVWTSLSMTPNLPTVPATGNRVLFEATWQKISCFGRCAGIVADAMTPLVVEAPD